MSDENRYPCPKCGSKTRMMIQVTMSIPSEMMSQLSKKNIAKKEVEIWGVSWDSADHICTNPKCGFTYDGLGSYIKNLEKENAELKAKIAGGVRVKAYGNYPLVAASYTLMDDAANATLILDEVPET